MIVSCAFGGICTQSAITKLSLKDCWREIYIYSYYTWTQVQQKWAVVRGNSTLTFKYIEAALEFYFSHMPTYFFLVSEIVRWWRINKMRCRFFTYKYQPFIKKYHKLEPRPMARVHKKLFDLFLYLNLLIPKTWNEHSIPVLLKRRSSKFSLVITRFLILGVWDWVSKEQ